MPPAESPSRVTAGFTRLTPALFAGIKKEKKKCPQAQLPFWGLREREAGEWQVGADPGGRVAQGEAGRAGGPELRVSCWSSPGSLRLGISLGLPTSYFVSAQRFCPFQEEGELKPAACLLTGEVSSRRRWKIFPGHSPGLAAAGTQLSRRPGQGWDSAGRGHEDHVWGSSPAMGC